MNGLIIKLMKEGLIIEMIKESKFKIYVKTNKNQNKLMGFDQEKQAYVLEINAKPIENEANKEIVRFLSKLLKKKVVIKSGLKSKIKYIEVL